MKLRFWYKKRKGFDFHVVPKRKIRDKKCAEIAEDFLKWNDEQIAKRSLYRHMRIDPAEAKKDETP